MTLGDLVGPDLALPLDWAGIGVRGLTADSREVEDGFVFAALPGTETDGARFIADAIARGAAAILLPADSPARAGVELPVIEDTDPRRRLALMAARFSGAQPETVAAVTGTNGKTSVAAFLRQIWQALGHDAASLGTVGVISATGTRALPHTTPEPVNLHRILAELAARGVSHLALEASSHGLQQRRLDGVRIAAAAFTNITRDHLDYHADFEAYLGEKLRLFNVLLPDDGIAVYDADAPGGDAVERVVQRRGLRGFTIGLNGRDIRLLDAARDGFSQRLAVEHAGRRHDIRLPLVGAFQGANALTAAALAIALGAGPAAVFEAVAGLEGATGRLEHVATTPAGARVFIDYAHTPDALGNALEALRPYAGHRLIVVFGCGGDRDRGKRPDMGRVATEAADLVYVTDDNPRGEPPETIRAAILAEAPGALEIGDRKEAIATALAEAGGDDLVLIAGKGHEQGQTIAGAVIPFSDHEAVRSALGDRVS